MSEASHILGRHLRLLGFGEGPESLVTAVRELADNAVEACIARGHERHGQLVCVRAQHAADTASIEVTDTGTGLTRAGLADLVTSLFCTTKGGRDLRGVGQFGLGVKGLLYWVQARGGDGMTIVTRPSGGSAPLLFRLRAQHAGAPASDGQPLVTEEGETPVTGDGVRGTQFRVAVPMEIGLGLDGAGKAAASYVDLLRLTGSLAGVSVIGAVFGIEVAQVPCLRVAGLLRRGRSGGPAGGAVSVQAKEGQGGRETCFCGLAGSVGDEIEVTCSIVPEIAAVGLDTEGLPSEPDRMGGEVAVRVFGFVNGFPLPPTTGGPRCALVDTVCNQRARWRDHGVSITPCSRPGLGDVTRAGWGRPTLVRRAGSHPEDGGGTCVPVECVRQGSRAAPHSVGAAELLALRHGSSRKKRAGARGPPSLIALDVCVHAQYCGRDVAFADLSKRALADEGGLGAAVARALEAALAAMGQVQPPVLGAAEEAERSLLAEAVAAALASIVANAEPGVAGEALTLLGEGLGEEALRGVALADAIGRLVCQRLQDGREQRRDGVDKKEKSDGVY